MYHVSCYIFWKNCSSLAKSSVVKFTSQNVFRLWYQYPSNNTSTNYTNSSVIIPVTKVSWDIPVYSNKSKIVHLVPTSQISIWSIRERKCILFCPEKKSLKLLVSNENTCWNFHVKICRIILVFLYGLSPCPEQDICLGFSIIILLLASLEIRSGHNSELSS